MVTTTNKESKSSVTKRNVLIVDDDPESIELLKSCIEEEQFQVLSAFDGETAINMVKEHSPDLVILDVNIPGMNGYEVCHAIRKNEKFSDLPIVFLSGRNLEVDRITGLEFGADDYISKPFHYKELILRVNNILKRVYGMDPSRLRVGPLEIDVGGHVVCINGNAISLTLTEFKLLLHLVQDLGKVKSRESLLHAIWDGGDGVYSRTIDTHIQRLRSKLKSLGDQIETIRGIGYRFKNI